MFDLGFKIEFLQTSNWRDDISLALFRGENSAINWRVPHVPELILNVFVS